MAWLQGTVTTAITKCAGNTPGAGKASVKYWDGSAMVDDADLQNVDVKNWFETYGPKAGKHVNLYWSGNVLWLGPGDCGS